MIRATIRIVLDTQKDVFRELVNLYRSSIRPEELAFTLVDRKIDSIPPDVLLALQKCPSEDRGLLFRWRFWEELGPKAICD